MTEKIYDEDGFDQNGYDRDGVNVYGEMDPNKAEMVLEKEDIRAVLKMKAGRRFLWELISYCKVYDDFDPDQSDKQDQKQMGRRGVGLYIMGRLEEADKDAFLQMMNENHALQKEKDYARTKYR